MNTLTCICCNKTNEEHKMISCCICKEYYLHSCADLSASEVRIIKSKKNLSWTCKNCSHIGDSMQDLKALIISLQREVENLKSLKLSAPNNSPFDFEEIIQEITDRNARKNNIIIYGIPENTSADRNEKILHDTQQVTEVIKCILPDTESTYKPIRLGKFDANRTKPRPIKITLSTTNNAHDIIHNAHKLKSQRELNSVRVSLDKTPKQQEYYRKLKAELSKRTSDGENNLRIKYIRGSPQIVSSN